MSGWLLSVAGIVVVGALVEVLLTDSPMSKFIRGIIGFFILLVIIQPLPDFFKNEVFSVGGKLELDTELLQTINSQTAKAFEINTQNALNIAGFSEVLITVDYEKGSMKFEISKVYVNAFGVVLGTGTKGIDIEKEITKIVAEVCNIDEGRIVYAG